MTAKTAVGVLLHILSDASVSAFHNRFSVANSSTAHGPQGFKEFNVSYGSVGSAKGSFISDSVTVCKIGS